MGLVKFVSAVVTRALFLLVSLIAVSRVAFVKKDIKYWCLTILFLPLVVEMIITLKSREGKAYKWISPPIFLFLISIIPSIWILEIDSQQDKSINRQCKKLDSFKDFQGIITLNKTGDNQTYPDLRKNIGEVYSNVCANTWILGIHQILLILLIVGKWLLPLGGGVTRGELSQLLLIFVGTAADILEFTSETLSDIKDKHFVLVYVILAVWTWSMLQFPFICRVMVNSEGEEGDQGVSLLTKHSTDVWSIVEALFIQDGPFLVVRFIVLTRFEVFHQMLVFFAIKNFLVVILNLYRLCVICQDYRDSRGSALP